MDIYGVIACIVAGAGVVLLIYLLQASPRNQGTQHGGGLEGSWPAWGYAPLPGDKRTQEHTGHQAIDLPSRNQDTAIRVRSSPKKGLDWKHYLYAGMWAALAFGIVTGPTYKVLEDLGVPESVAVAIAAVPGAFVAGNIIRLILASFRRKDAAVADGDQFLPAETIRPT